MERQLVMQLLDLTSLTQIASTCRQMGAEALHKEAGKFILQPQEHPWNVWEVLERTKMFHLSGVTENHPAHVSSLFRIHAPMTLCIDCFDDQLMISGDPWLNNFKQAATFARIQEITLYCSIGEGWGLPRWCVSDLMHEYHLTSLNVQVAGWSYAAGYLMRALRCAPSLTQLQLWWGYRVSGPFDLIR